MNVQFLWFNGCPNHEAARTLLMDVLAAHGLEGFEDIDAGDADIADMHRFPGSPTIRVNGVDIEPGYIDPEDYVPRCRVYLTEQGLRGVPERRWIEDALEQA